MSFLNPYGLAFLALVPPLILLYFLKLKRPRHEVSSTLLWQKVVEDLRVNSPFQRLRRSLLLLLQLLLLLLLIGALARPLLRGAEARDSSVIVLLDVSISMAAREPDGKTRLAHAKEQVSALIDGLESDSEMMIVTFHAAAREVCSFTNNQRELREAVRRLEATDCATDATAAIAIARSLATTRQNPRIVLFSDGNFPDPGRLELTVPIEFVKVGSELPNVAITGLDMRRALSDPDLIEMFVAIQNFGAEDRRGNMSVYLDDALLDTKYLSIEAGKSLSQIFEAAIPTGGMVRVDVDIDDALPADNHAWQVIPPPRVRRVLVVDQRPYFVRRVFKASPEIELVVVAPDAYVSPPPDQYSAVIWGNVPAPEVAPTNNLYLGCAPPVAGLALGAMTEAPGVMDWDSAHPLTRFIDLSNLIIGAAPVLALPPGGAAIVRSPEAPLIGVFQHDGRDHVVVAFDIYQSNWPMLVSFPLFLHNCLGYFDMRQMRSTNTNIVVGNPISVPGTAEDVRVVRPGGAAVRPARSGTGDYNFAAVDRCGVYRIEQAGAEPLLVAANLFNRRESNLMVEEYPIAENDAVATVTVAGQTNREYGRWLLLATVVLLLLEWLVYHRRILA